jgi:hypothetical protein
MFSQFTNLPTYAGERIAHNAKVFVKWLTYKVLPLH